MKTIALLTFIAVYALLLLLPKYRAVSAFTNFPGYQGRKLSVQLYRLARKIYKFN